MKRKSTASAAVAVAEEANGNGNGVDEPQLQPQSQPQAAVVETEQTQTPTLTQTPVVNGAGDGDETLVPQLAKLDDGFYEIEAIRRKRVRKGQRQYLIKWRGWPETANTWEPLENLQSIPDVIDAFEDSLKSGKHRKRKRKHVTYHTQPKKRQQRSTTSYSLRHFTTDNHPQPAPSNFVPPSDLPAHPQTIIFVDGGETNGDACGLGKAKQANENGFPSASNQIVERNEENDYDPKLSELRATTNNGVDADKLAIYSQQDKASTGNGHVDGQSKVDCTEPVQGGRCRGAKRRKSGSVKRFRREMYASEPLDTKNPISMPVGTFEPGWTGVPAYVGNDGHKKMGDARTANDIVKIIKPVGYAASLSGNMQDVLVTFIAMRSDGEEVMVDNNFLKANYPLLLIDFYEQHLQYSPTALTKQSIEGASLCS